MCKRWTNIARDLFLFFPSFFIIIYFLLDWPSFISLVFDVSPTAELVDGAAGWGLIIYY